MKKSRVTRLATSAAMIALVLAHSSRPGRPPRDREG